MRSLELIDSWPVGVAAAGIAGGAGEREARGDTQQVFPWASVTKLLTALAVLVAVEEGTVDLDEEVVPWGATTRHVLAHASGLAPDPPPRRLAAPETRRIYSNAGFELLGALVAERAGMAFTEYLSIGVLDPLEMAATKLEGSPAYGISGPLDDLLRLAAELLSPTLLAPATLAEATTTAYPGLAGVLPGFGRQPDCAFGLGFEVRDSKSPHWTAPAGSPRTFGHFGRSGTFLWVDPDERVACAVLTDREFGDWAIEAWPALSQAVLTEWQAGARLRSHGDEGSTASGR